MTNPAEQAQQQLRELRDSLHAQLADECICIGRHLAESRARRDKLKEAMKRVEAELAPRTRKRKEPAAQ